MSKPSKKAKKKPAPKRRAAEARMQRKKPPARTKSRTKLVAKRPGTSRRATKPGKPRDVLELIAAGDFAGAMTSIARSPAAALALDDAAQVFNYAAAAWGRDGAPSLPLFQRALALASREQLFNENTEDANFHQCLAMAAAAVQDRAAARQALEKSKRLASRLGAGREFSGWRYREASQAEFLRDLDDLARMIDDPTIIPAFLAR